MKTVRSTTLNYEQLVSAYWNNLTTVLRGFTVGSDLYFLDAWVPEDDPERGVLSVLEAAKDGGLEEITLQLGAETLNKVSPQQICHAAAKYGEVHAELRGPDLHLFVRFCDTGGDLASGPSSASVRKGDGSVPSQASGSSEIYVCSDGGKLSSGYAAALRDLISEFLHELAPDPQPRLQRVSSTESGTELIALIDSRNHYIKEIGFQGATSEEQRRILELLCRIAKGRPIQDASDHAIIELEYRLRRNIPHQPLRGIVMPENVSSAFAQPLELIRRLAKTYWEHTGHQQTRNSYDTPVAFHWRQLSEAERLSRIQSAIGSHPSGLGVKVIRLDGLQRFVVEFDQHAAGRHCDLLDLEKHVKTNVESTLYLYLQPRLDQNKLRRLNESGGQNHGHAEHE